MDSNITINIVEPASPTPVDPGTGTVVPDTGLFTHGIGGAGAAIIVTVGLVAILAIIIAVLYYRNKKQGKLISLKHSKATTIGLTTLALIISIGTVAGLLRLGASAADDSLTLTASSTDFTIEVGDEPVFAVLPVELTVAEATQAGYTLTAYAESTGLASTTNSSDIIPMVTVEEDELAALADNTYGLALAKPKSQEDEVYVALSTDADTPTLITDKDYKATEENDTTTIYYGFYITPNVPYGTYTGSSINYQANPNYITNLTFNGNGSDGRVDMEGMTLLAGDTITLPQNTFTREGYSFTGWNTQADGEGVSYADEAEFTASLTESEDITLYAQWKKNAPYMQDIATWGSDLQMGDEITAVDKRDGKEYYVARLADNNIWMTQNLDHDIGDIEGGTYTPNDTDISADWVPSSGEYTKQTGDTSWGSGGVVSGSWNPGNITTPESYDPGALYWNGAITYDEQTCEENGGTWQWGSCENADVVMSAGNSHYYTGNYYNWTAAVAMSDSSLYTADGQDINQSICPAGWRLPNLSEDKSYQNLVDKQGLTVGADGNIQSSPAYFMYGGSWGGNSIRMGNRGDYWSSVVRGSNYSYTLSFSVDGYLAAQGGGWRNGGFFIRCLVR